MEEHHQRLQPMAVVVEEEQGQLAATVQQPHQELVA
jgi:hypothetical protein